MMVAAAREVAPMIAGRPWVVLETTAPAFLTSDRPVTFWRDRQRRDPYTGVGLHNADAVYFPLDPRKMLVIMQGQTESWERRTPTRAEVREVNTIVANWSYRFIFHHPNHRPIEEHRLSRDSHLLVVNGRRIGRNQNLWNLLRGAILSEGQYKEGQEPGA
jgi:hypothetical protein